MADFSEPLDSVPQSETMCMNGYSARSNGRLNIIVPRVHLSLLTSERIRCVSFALLNSVVPWEMIRVNGLNEAGNHIRVVIVARVSELMQVNF